MTTRNRTEAFRMQRNLHLLAFASLWRSPFSQHHYIQDDDNVVETRLPISRQTASSRIPLPLVIFYAFFAGFLFSAFTGLTFLQPLPPVCRCGGAQEDSSNSRKLGIGNNNNYPRIESPKILGFVGVQTSFSSADRRAALRSTWFPSNPDALRRLELTTGLVFRFVIGRSKDAKHMADLEKEIKRYGDFLLMDIEEEYLNLPYKTLAFFKAAYDHFEADYYVKADDDIYLRPDRLATLLAKERTDPMTYIGCMKRGRVISDPQMIWFEKSRRLIANEYFLYGYGSIYVLSEKVVAALAVASDNSLRMFSNEEVSVGLWMLAMNVSHEDSRALCDPQCTPTSIAVWDFPGCSGLCSPVNRLKELHKINLCSKSPTLPSDDR